MNNTDFSTILTIYEASTILTWMLGQTPQHPNKTKTKNTK